MNRKRSRRNSNAPAEESTPAPEPAGQLPSERVRTALSIWVCIHLFALLVSFTAVVEPSTIHARLVDLFHPYLRPTHFGADDRPVYLAYGDVSEQPHVLQVSNDGENWRTVEPEGSPGLAVSDRMARWLSTAAMLAENQQPSLVAELLLPVALNDDSITAIRILRLPTDLNDVRAEAETPYVARVVRDGDDVSLVKLSEERLSAEAVSAAVLSPPNRRTALSGRHRRTDGLERPSYDPVGDAR